MSKPSSGSWHGRSECAEKLKIAYLSTYMSHATDLQLRKYESGFQENLGSHKETPGQRGGQD